MRSVSMALMLGAVSACSRSDGSAACGIQALAAPLAVKQAFGIGNALAIAPDTPPATLAVRLVAGPVWPATITVDSNAAWHITARGTVSKQAQIGYGALVVGSDDRSLGVLVFPGPAIPGAVRLGTLAIGDTIVPLLGVRIDPAAIHDPACPLFPDSIR